MQNILIGSRALNYWFPSHQINESTDWDVISEKPIEGCEHHPIELLNNSDCFKYTSSSKIVLPNGEDALVMIPLGLTLVKRSHLWRDLSFAKHISHYHKVLKHYRAWDDNDKSFLDTRTELTKKAYPRITPNLMQTKSDFFDDGVNKKYEHDFLHELFSYYSQPLYVQLLRKEGWAWCDEEKWNLLSFNDKILCVAEEVQVIAAERFLIPKDWVYNSRIAYLKALEKVCTTLCSGWFRGFAIDNYPLIVQQYDHSRFEKVKAMLEFRYI